MQQAVPFRTITLSRYNELVEVSDLVNMLDLGGVSYSVWEHPEQGLIALSNTSEGQCVQMDIIPATA